MSPHLRRLILVADRGLLSLDNLQALQSIRLSADQSEGKASKAKAQSPGKGQDLEFIIAVPGRRYGEFAKLLEPLQRKCAQANAEITAELAWNGLRLVVAHDPAMALAQQQKRRAVIAELEAQAASWAGKLDEQDQGTKKRGRKLSDSGAKARFYHAVCEASLGKIIRIDLKEELFSYTIDEAALQLAEMMDGKLLVVTNVQDMTPDKVIERYKSLADIERGFKVLKSELEIGPVYHRLPERIRAHASICFMALILHRVMRMRLRAGGQYRHHTRAGAASLEAHPASPCVDQRRAATLRRVFDDCRTACGADGTEGQTTQSIQATQPVVGARFEFELNEIKHLRLQLANSGAPGNMV